MASHRGWRAASLRHWRARRTPAPPRVRQPCPTRRGSSRYRWIARQRPPGRCWLRAKLGRSPVYRRVPKRSRLLAGRWFCLGWIARTDLDRRPRDRPSATAVPQARWIWRASGLRALPPAWRPPRAIRSACPSSRMAHAPRRRATPGQRVSGQCIRPAERTPSRPRSCASRYAPPPLLGQPVALRTDSWRTRVVAPVLFPARRPRVPSTTAAGS